MTVHPPDCECDAYACQMRRKGVQVSAAATPTRSGARRKGDS